MKLTLSLAAAVAMTAALYAQRDPSNFSNNATTVTTAEDISPDGTRVLVNQNGTYGTIPWGATSAAQFTSLGLSSLNIRKVIWAPNSAGVYFAEEVFVGTQTFVNLRYQGAPANRSVVLNTNPPVRLFLVDRQNQFLYGTTRTVIGGVTNTTIVRVPTTGPGSVQQLRTLVGGTVGEMDIDPSGTQLLMQFLPQGGPFLPQSVLAMPANGLSAPVTLSSGFPRTHVAWINGSASAVFVFRDSNITGNNFLQIGRVDVSNPGTIIQLTGGLRNHDQLDTNDDQSLLAYEVLDGNTGTTPSFESVPAVMPSNGGGEILLTALRRFDMLGTDRIRISTTTANGTRIAYSAREFGVDTNYQLYGQSLENEITITPAAGVGANLTVSFANPGSPANFVAVLLNLTRVNIPSLPPVVDPIFVDPVGALAVIGITNTPNPTGMVAVPTNAVFVDVNLYFQAVTGLPTGALRASRMVEAAILP